MTGDNIPGNVTPTGLEGFWIGFLIALAIMLLFVTVFLCAYFYNKKQKQKAQLEKIQKEEIKLLEQYRHLNENDKANLNNIISNMNHTESTPDEPPKKDG